MARYTVKEVSVSSVTKGKNSYQVADVVYETDRGETKEKKVMSFSNPAVFAIVAKISSPTVVEVENSGAPYYNWTEIKLAGDAAAKPAAAKGGTYVDNRETPDERRMRQLMIVRQSSISNAIEYWKAKGYEGIAVEEVLGIAQAFVDFVYGNDLETVGRGNEAVSEE